MLAGVGVRVGVNAARLAYPAPSGVVDYRLREAGPVDQFRLGVGFRDFGARVVQGDASLRRGDFSFAGGFVWRPLASYAGGGKGRALDVGGVWAWEPAPGQRLRAFASLYQRRYDGDYAIVASEAAMPPPLRSLHQYSPAWAVSDAMSTNLGVLYDGRVGGFTVNLAAFDSLFHLNQDDYTLVFADAAGRASATTYRFPVQDARSDSVEARVGRRFEAGGLSHQATLSLRGRRSITDLTSDFAVPLGEFDLVTGDPPDGPAPAAWSGTYGRDAVRQLTASAGYALAWRDRVELRFAVHRTRYDKSVLSFEGVRTGRVSETTLYNASAIVSLGARTSAFGSWVTGLEEAGTAPVSATNRYEVLPPTEAEQFELGVRHELKPGLTLIGALFDVSKPTNGMRADGSFGLVGQVRHRGVEGSVAGKLDSRTGVVLGVVAFQPKVSGPLVEAGAVGPHAAGVSSLVANASIERRISAGWSVDANLSYSGARWADTANSFKAPAVTTLSLGARRRFAIADRPAELRVLASNLAGTRGYWVAPSGLLTPIAPRTIRAVLTVVFGPQG